MMKKQLLLWSTITLSTTLFAQNNGNGGNNGQGVTHWKTNGNIIGASEYIGTKNEKPVIFKSNDTERIRISSDGYVGIGTSTPQTKLDIDGDVTLRAGIYLSGLTQANGLTDVIFINQNGELKTGGIEMIGQLLYEDKVCSNVDIQSPMWANGLNKIFSKCPQVFIGIGTSTPLYKLDVRGNTYVSSSMGIGIEPAPNDVQLILKTQSNRDVGVCIDHNVYGSNSYAYKAIVHDEVTKGIGIYSELYGKDIFTIYSNGKLEISNATGKILQLEADGLLRGRQIKLDLNSWADYVFDDNYELMPLEELESFVKKEKRLPGIPSEDELKKEGLDLTEMSRTQMEKVEELTLYLIDQNKSIEDLKTEIEALNKRISELESNK